jgi:hypothetical protein
VGTTVEAVDEVRGRASCGLTKRPEIEVDPDHRSHLQQAEVHLVHTAQAATDQILDALRKYKMLRRGEVLRLANDLLDEEGVAVRSGMDGCDQAGRRVRSRLGRDDRADRLLVETVERDLVEHPRAPCFRQRADHRVLAGDLGVPVGDQHEQRRALRLAHEVAERHSGGVLRPVQVLEDEDRRA